MLRRGIQAQPILNGFCGEWEVPYPDEVPPMSTPPSPTTAVTPAPVITTTTPTTQQPNLTENSTENAEEPMKLTAEHPIVRKENTTEIDQPTDKEVPIPIPIQNPVLEINSSTQTSATTTT